MKKYNFPDAFYKMQNEQKFGVRTRRHDFEIFCITSFNIDHPINDSGILLMEYDFEEAEWDRCYMISGVNSSWLLFDTFDEAMEYAKRKQGDKNE